MDGQPARVAWGVQGVDGALGFKQNESRKECLGLESGGFLKAQGSTIKDLNLPL